MSLLKYEQIAESLRARIAEGEFGPGDLLPSGRDLTAQWGVSRATVVKAMDVLRDDGLVTARQGSGFTVTQTPLARPAGARHAGSGRLTGGTPYRLLGTPQRATPPARVAEWLGLIEGQEALRRERLALLDDGTPLTLVTAWFPPSVADAGPRLACPEPITEGTTHYVRRQTGRSPVEGTDAMTVRLASDEEAATLEIATPGAVAVVLHVALDRNGDALVCEEGVTASHLFERVENYPMAQ